MASLEFESGKLGNKSTTDIAALFAQLELDSGFFEEPDDFIQETLSPLVLAAARSCLLIHGHRASKRKLHR